MVYVPYVCHSFLNMFVNIKLQNIIIPFDNNILSRASNITDDSFQWFTVQDKTPYTDYLMNINGGSVNESK